jgi:glucuronate isomerase
MSVMPLRLDPDRFFPADAQQRDCARALYHSIAQLPILSPHGHTDPAWFADDQPFANATDLLVTPDHYVLRMLYSQGIPLTSLGVVGEGAVAAEPRAAWRCFAENYHLFRATPSRAWLDHVFHDVFQLRERLCAASADLYYDQINAALATEAFHPRALLERFNVRFIATTEGALDPLQAHARLRGTPWAARITTTFRPDDVVDPDNEEFAANVVLLGEMTGEDTACWEGYLAALRARRAYFRAAGAVATDHGHPTARTADLPPARASQLFESCIAGQANPEERELFRAQMLTEMATMSRDDGMVMQIHPGSWRNHNARLFAGFGPNCGADIPQPTDFVGALKPLLDRFGNCADLTVILFTLDETAYARELAPLAGHYPCLRLGPPWWFHDSPEGMLRYRRQVTETAGFYNSAGFNDDTRALLSIPARHDLARRIDCRFLAELVCEGRLDRDEALELAAELAYGLAYRSYRLDRRPLPI